VLNPGFELALFLNACLTVPLRRAHERDLLREYQAVLSANGVTGYSEARCLADTQAGLIAALPRYCYAVMHLLPLTAERALTLRTWIIRDLAAIIDHRLCDPQAQ
jgi:hypothetical protein